MPNVPTQNTLDRINESDLAHPNQFVQKLNKLFQFVGQRVARLEGVTSGDIRIQSTISAPSLKSDVTDIPTDESVVLNRRVADKLYGPRVIRKSLITREWVDGSPVGSLPSRAVDGLVAVVVEGLHSDRSLIDVDSKDVGYAYYETDRNALYVTVQSSTTGVRSWQLISAEMVAVYASRPSDLGSGDIGFKFFASDYKHHWEWTGAAWKVLSGVMRGTISPDQKPSLAADDVEFRFYSTDYSHTYRWDGSAWEYAPEDDGSGYVEWWCQVPNRGTWVIADGTPTTKSTRLGATAAITPPNVVGAFPYGIAAGYTGVQEAAVAPGISGETADESAHTHGTGTLATSTVPDHSHTESMSVTTSGPSANTVVQSGTGATVASSAHSHTASASGTTGNAGAHSHTMSGSTGTGSAHKHGTGTLAVDDTGKPVRIGLLPYYRL